MGKRKKFGQLRFNDVLIATNIQKVLDQITAGQNDVNDV